MWHDSGRRNVRNNFHWASDETREKYRKEEHLSSSCDLTVSGCDIRQGAGGLASSLRVRPIPRIRHNQEDGGGAEPSPGTQHTEVLNPVFFVTWENKTSHHLVHIELALLFLMAKGTLAGSVF